VQLRKRRRTVLLLVASLSVLIPIGWQIQRASTSESDVLRPGAGMPTEDTQQQPSQAPPPPSQPLPSQPPSPSRPPPSPSQQPHPSKPANETGAMDPALSRAFDKARIAARAAGLQLRVTSGYRTAATQQRFYDEALTKYGSAEKARHWVLPPAESDHVKGLAIDVGPRAGAAWLEKNGVRYGLCRRYANEWWHFERLAPAVGQRCPAWEPFAGG
jgi:D-alanyl-D-alanine carboxypeptidase